MNSSRERAVRYRGIEWSAHAYTHTLFLLSSWTFWSPLGSRGWPSFVQPLNLLAGDANRIRGKGCPLITMRWHQFFYLLFSLPLVHTNPASQELRDSLSVSCSIMWISKREEVKTDPLKKGFYFCVGFRTDTLKRVNGSFGFMVLGVALIVGSNGCCMRVYMNVCRFTFDPDCAVGPTEYSN